MQSSIMSNVAKGFYNFEKGFYILEKGFYILENGIYILEKGVYCQKLLFQWFLPREFFHRVKEFHSSFTG